MCGMSSVRKTDTDETTVEALPPEEALKRAAPLPPREELIVEGVTDEQWDAFFQAIARR